MKKFFLLIASLALIGILFLIFVKSDKVKLVYPFNNAVFPGEFTSPTFRWNDPDSTQKAWLIQISTYDRKFTLHRIVYERKWKPELSTWDSLKANATTGKIVGRVSRYNIVKGKAQHEDDEISFSISSDKVEAPILYREVILPFYKAELMLDSMTYRLCNVGSPDPAHVAMKGFPVCGNCHSVSENGKTLALDLDAGNRDKGGYFIANIEDTIVFDKSNYISWSQIQNRNTFGMFSKISPNGRYIVTTMKDRIVLKNYDIDIPEQIKYSQLFFPVNGVLGIYDRETGILKELPGANDPKYVQSNAIWTPDGESLIFAKAKALPYYGDSGKIVVTNTMLIQQFSQNQRTFKYDLYKIPFNDGKGGVATPIKGASHNGKSNYFPAISPDGRWMVFCQAQNFMLLMPDSKLHIVNMKTSKSKMMGCNFNSMNSWHTWSPNSKWIVFSSKGLSAYTDLFLSHIDENGRSSVPVLIENAHRENYAANYPEFVNISPSKKILMKYEFVEMTLVKNALYKESNIPKAKEYFRQFMEQGNIKRASEFLELARIAIDLDNYTEAMKCIQAARDLNGNKTEIEGLQQFLNSKLQN